MHHELWLTSIINGQNNVGNSNYQNAGYMNNFQVPAIPNGYCIIYHQAHYCQLPCRYNHKCFKCNRLHPSYKCWQQQNVLNENANSFNNLRSSSTYRKPVPRFQIPQGNQRLPRPTVRHQTSAPCFRR